MANFIAGTGICSNCKQSNKQGNLCFHCQINQEISAPSTSQTVSFPAKRYAQITYHLLEPKTGFDGVGIYMNDSYLITSIDPESPAELSGLRPSLSLVEINGKNISAQSFGENIKLMKESFSKNQNLIIGVIDTSAIFERQHLLMRRLIKSNFTAIESYTKTCLLYKNESFSGYGISLLDEGVPPEVFQAEHDYHLALPCIDIKANSPADKAGIKSGQRILAIDNQFIGKHFDTFEDAALYLEGEHFRHREYTVISVIDADVWEIFMDNPDLVGVDLPECEELDYILESSGLSAFFKQYFLDLSSNQHPGFVLNNSCFIEFIQAGSPAEASGLRIGQKIVFVNLRVLVGCDKEEITAEIAKC